MNTECFEGMMGKINLSNPHICSAESIPGLTVQTLSMDNGEKKVTLDIGGSYTSLRTLLVSRR